MPEREPPKPAAGPGFWQLAFDGPVVRRGLVLAAAVGPVLIAINHGDAILAGSLGSTALVKMALTLLVPYVVSTVSSVSALRGLQR